MPGESILIIEDDPTLLRGLKDNFTFKGYAVQTAADGEIGLQKAVDDKPDLIVLDLMLPKVNGYEICRRVREEGLDIPIIMLTAKSEESDVILGLNLGADDYVTKPFSIKELLARANALLRRRRQEEPKMLLFGEFTLDLVSHRLLDKEKNTIELTPKEFALLALLAERPGRAFTRNEILKAVWGYDVFVTTRSVDRCVTTLRAKIETDPHAPRFVQTVREVGYRFQVDEEQLERNGSA